MKLSWNAVVGAASYEVWRADSMYGNYQHVGDTTSTTYTDKNPNAKKYSNYYKIVGVNGATQFAPIYLSLENQTFGDNMIFFAPGDDTAAINDKVAEVYAEQENSQFGTGRYALMFKKGDYTATNEMNVGFYTQVAGLGKLYLCETTSQGQYLHMTLTTVIKRCWGQKVF